MLNSKKISIVIPVYNVEEYIDRCLVSVINQTYKNIEIILVDDGSIDLSPQKCEEWAVKDNRVLVYHKKNGGLSDARNYGLKKSSGDYLMFVDSDDWIDITMVEKMVTAIENDKSDMAICQFIMVYPDGTTEKSINSINDNTLISKEEAIKLLLEDNRISNHVWRKLYKKEFFDCSFPVGKNYEDMYITWKLIDNCNKISLLDYPLYFYKQNDKGIVSNINVKNLRDFYNGVLVASDNIEKLYPQYKAQIDNYRLNKMLSIYKLSYVKCDKNTLNDFKELRKTIIRYISKITVSNIYGKKNKIKFIMMKYFHIDKFVGKDFLKKIKKIVVNLVYIKKYRRNLKKNFWIFGIPEYGNLGDHLLLKGEIEFISKYFPDFEIKTVPVNDLEKINSFFIRKCVKKDDICAIQAGGNMGTLYPWIHLRQEYILKLMKKEKRNIFVFPQTYYYIDDTNGTTFLNNSKQVYSNSRILIFTRDEKSYDFCKRNFDNSLIFLVPDIALILKKNVESDKRHGMLYCLRTDAESTIELRELDFLYKIVEKHFDSIDVCDTHSYVPLKHYEANLEIDKLCEKFSKSKLVITDRLHGMIMAVITHTPCIVINSKSHKIMGVYKWLNKINYIKLIKDINDLEETILELNNINDLNTNVDLNIYWEKMYQEIKKTSVELPI